MRTVATFAGDLYVGSPWLLSAAGPLGAAGAILAVANVEPALSIAAFAGDAAAQRALADAASSAAGPANVKRALGRSPGDAGRLNPWRRPAGCRPGRSGR